MLCKATEQYRNRLREQHNYETDLTHRRLDQMHRIADGRGRGRLDTTFRTVGVALNAVDIEARQSELNRNKRAADRDFGEQKAAIQAWAKQGSENIQRAANEQIRKLERAFASLLV